MSDSKELTIAELWELGRSISALMQSGQCRNRGEIEILHDAWNVVTTIGLALKYPTPKGPQ